LILTFASFPLSYRVPRFQRGIVGTHRDNACNALRVLTFQNQKNNVDAAWLLERRLAHRDEYLAAPNS
jgi:hypothetical protein